MNATTIAKKAAITSASLALALGVCVAPATAAHHAGTANAFHHAQVKHDKKKPQIMKPQSKKPQSPTPVKQQWRVYP